VDSVKEREAEGDWVERREEGDWTEREAGDDWYWPGRETEDDDEYCEYWLGRGAFWNANALSYASFDQVPARLTLVTSSSSSLSSTNAYLVALLLVAPLAIVPVLLVGVGVSIWRLLRESSPASPAGEAEDLVKSGTDLLEAILRREGLRERFEEKKWLSRRLSIFRSMMRPEEVEVEGGRFSESRIFDGVVAILSSTTGARDQHFRRKRE
jgi:hypothetical protein